MSSNRARIFWRTFFLGLVPIAIAVVCYSPKVRQLWNTGAGSAIPILGPLFVLLVYFALVVFWKLMSHSDSDEAQSDVWGSVQSAFREAQRVGLSPMEKDLFLVLGLPSSMSGKFFSFIDPNGGIHISETNQPVQLHGDKNALWLAVPKERFVNLTAPTAKAGIDSSEQDDRYATFNGLAGTIGGDTSLAPAQNTSQFGTLVAAKPSPPAQSQFTGVGNAQFVGLDGEPDIELSKTFALQQPPAPELATTSLTPPIEMTELAQCLRAERYPWVPINGAIVCISYDELCNPNTKVFHSIWSQLEQLQLSIGVRCMVIVAVYGIENDKGFRAFIDRSDEKHRSARIGCGFPELVALDIEDHWRLHEWLTEYFEQQVYKKMVDRIGDSKMNLNLSLLPARFRRAEAAFRTNLGMAFKSKSNVEPFYFGGMYFVSAAAHDGRPAFVRGVIDKMRSDADSMVGWSQWVLDEEASKRQKQKFLFLILAFLILLNASLLVWAIWRFI